MKPIAVEVSDNIGDDLATAAVEVLRDGPIDGFILIGYREQDVSTTAVVRTRGRLRDGMNGIAEAMEYSIAGLMLEVPPPVCPHRKAREG